MVKIGEVFWVASVKGADSAVAQADELEDSMGSVASTAQEAASAQNEYGDEVEGTSEAIEDAGLMSNRAGTATDLLGSSLFFAAKQFGIASAAAKGYAATLGLVRGVGAAATGLGGMIAGTSLGSLVSKVTFASLLKGAASLGALVIAADTIGALIDGKDPITAFVTSAEDFGEFILNPIGIENNLVEGVAGIGTFILGTMSIASFITDVAITAMIKGAAASIASFLGVSSLSSLVTGAGASIATFLTTASLGTLVAGAGSIALLIGGVASLGDLVDGDISSWNLPAKFGRALGQGFRDAWPNMADSIHTAFTNNPIHDAGQVVGREGTGAITGPAGSLERSTAAFLDPRQGWEFTGFQSGGMVQETGPAFVHENEAILPASLVNALTGPGASGRNGRGGGETTVEQTYEIDVGDQSVDLSRLDRSTLRTLARMIGNEVGNSTGNLAGGK